MNRKPTLWIQIPLESPGRIVFDADTWKDERRLRQWLRGSTEYRLLPELLARVLDDLDKIDATGDASPRTLG